VIKTLTQQNITFAVRSGGHMPSPKAANINGGVLIDLSSLNQFRYDATTKLVTIGAGLKWGDVYQQLDQYQVTAVGGRVLDVGVGGYLLGGE
jgi:FAD/FMN-containing dehydrogenase